MLAKNNPQRHKVDQLLKMQPQAGPVTVYGWVRTMRDQKSFAFVELYDGTGPTLQVLLDGQCPEYPTWITSVTTGSAVEVTGELVSSPGSKQSVELRAHSLRILGSCPAESYPLQKKRHSLEFLRSIAHLRPRTNTIGAVTRVRNRLAASTHQYFQEQGFLYVQTPIITTSDCEGAGQLFKVTTLDLERVPRDAQAAVDYSHDFFGTPAFLTVSGQLEAESYASALGDVYTFGPTFRAENSNTSRHLAEFWMVEPEMAFATLDDVIELAEGYLKATLRAVLEHCHNDLEFFNKWVRPGVLPRIEKLITQPFQRITYTEAIALLAKADRKFEFPCDWGKDLQSEHERYLCEELFKAPVVVTDYPKDIKAFYMRLNADERTVAAMDVLCPDIGEIIGGSQREERLDILEQRIIAQGMRPEDYSWYLDLRRYGSHPHGGFGLGFERLVQFVTGVENIRDCIPFPRTPKHAAF